MTFSISGLAILALACIGNAELWVIFINRHHAQRYRHDELLRVRRFHDVGILCFPPFILAYAGLGEQGLLYGGHISDQSAAIQGILLITILGVVPLIGSSLRWNFRSSPAQLVATDSEHIDCLALAGSDEEKRQQVIGEADSVFASFPRNQIYQLESNRKQLRLSQRSGKASPDADRGKKRLKVAHFTDVHFVGTPGPEFHRIVIQQLSDMKPDLFVFTGDLLDEARLLPAAVDMFQKLAEVAPGYFILGNHDWNLQPDEIRNAIAATGWVDVSERAEEVEFDGVRVLLAGTEAPWMGVNPAVSPPSGEDLRLLLSHAPDQRDYAVANDFDLMLCGHNHGGQVVLPIIGPVYTPSIYGVQYAGGMFEHKGLVMHVSRGVGAKDLLRWSCRPEITLLEVEI